MDELLIGVDLGGTQTRAICAAADGHILTRKATPTLAYEGVDAVLNRICEQIDAAADGRPFVGIGIGAPGPTDPYAGIVLTAPNMTGWFNIKLRSELEARFQVPVFLGNDANLAALAEHRYGAGRGARDLIYITVSTGIGSGVIVDNRLLLGRQGLAGEIGHTTIDYTAEEKGVAQEGTLEGLASGPHIADRARHALAKGGHSAVLDLIRGDLTALTPQHLSRAAEQRDPFALEQFRIAGRYLGVGITNLLHTFNPERIVIGGSIWLHCRPFMEETMWEAIRTRTRVPQYWRNLEIVSAALGDDVGLLGALALAAAGVQEQRII